MKRGVYHALERAQELKQRIRDCCVESGVDITIQDGKFCIFDPISDEVIISWSPTHKVGEHHRDSPYGTK